MKDEIEKKYIGKVVATRGYSSGVNVGVCVAIDKQTVLITDAFFLRKWEYANAFGAMASLSSGDLTGGEISKIHHDAMICDCACVVVCPAELLEKCKKYAK